MPSRIVRPIIVACLAVVLTACASSARFQGMTADQLYALAQQEFGEGDYGNATEALETLLITFPGFGEAPAAQMLLARSWFEDGKYVTAQAEYRRFLDRHPGHPESAAAALGMCRSAEALSPISQRDQSFTEQALLVCGETSQTYPGTPEAEQAAAVAEAMREKLAKKTFETGAYYLRRGFHQSAILYFQVVLEEHENTSWAPRSLESMMEAYVALGYEDEVEAAKERLLTRYPDSPEARRIAGQTPAGAPAAGTSGA